jgi:hypothetical protein
MSFRESRDIPQEEGPRELVMCNNLVYMSYSIFGKDLFVMSSLTATWGNEQLFLFARVLIYGRP